MGNAKCLMLNDVSATQKRALGAVTPGWQTAAASLMEGIYIGPPVYLTNTRPVLALSEPVYPHTPYIRRIYGRYTLRYTRGPD